MTLVHAPHGTSGYVQLAVVTTGAGGVFTFGVRPTTSLPTRPSIGVFSRPPRFASRRAELSLQPGRTGWFRARGGRRILRRPLRIHRSAPASFGQWVVAGASAPPPANSSACRGASSTWRYRVFMTVNQAGAGTHSFESWSGTQTVGRP